MIVVKGCRLLIKPQDLEKFDPVLAKAKAAGLQLLDLTDRQQQTQVDRGTVLQIGNMCHEDYTEGLKVGDMIGYAKFGGKYIKDNDGVEYLVINDEDVVCVIKE